MARLAAVLVAAAGCSDPQPATPPAPASAAVSPDREALAEAWRQSVKYRSAHLALAANRESLRRDVEKIDRMLATVQAFRRVPVVSDAAADAHVVAEMLRTYAKTQGLDGAHIDVSTRPAPAPPPAVVSTRKSFDYTDAQIAGTHDVTVTLPNGLLSGPRFMGGLSGLDRLLVVEQARIDGEGRAVLRGQVYFFRDLKPVRFVRPPVDVDALLRAAAGVPPDGLDEKAKRRVAKIRENYARVEAVSADIDASLAHEAHLELATARFRFYSALVDRFNAARWTDLIGASKAKAK